MRSLLWLLGFTAALETGAAATESTRLLRFPDVSAEHVVFVYAGDLYRAPRDGGEATRLTAHPGLELFPKFSPDGRWIAFSAEYSGTRQVWVMPTAGGEPRQLTYYNDVGPMPPRGGYDYRVLDWSPDGTRILVRMNRLGFDERAGRPYWVPFAGGMEEPLPVPESGGGMLSPDGRAFVYTPIDREFRTWKRHRGGRAQDVWIFDLERIEARRLTFDPATDQQPLWVGDTIYFVSDREFTLNLYAMTPTGEGVRKITDFADYDVLWPSAGADAIVFERGGALWLYQPEGGAPRPLAIRVPSDRHQALPQVKNVARQIEAYTLAPKGERAVFAARGELYSVPAREGEIRALSRTPDAREIDVRFFPDGKHLLYASDASGEYEFYRIPTDGSAPPTRLTGDGEVWRFPPVIAPDGKRFAYGDKRQRLRIVEVDGGRTVDVDRATYGGDITEYTWSPDGRWLAYVKFNAAGLRTIWVYSVERARTQALTGAEFDAYAPSFDPKGRWLWFFSNRDFSLTYSAYEFNYVPVNATRVYAGILAADGPSPLRLKSDEVGQTPRTIKDEPGIDPVRIDADGFDRLVVGLKIPPGVYNRLHALEHGVLYLQNQPAAPGGSASADLKLYDLDGEREETVLRGVTDYVVAAGGEHLLFRSGSQFGIAEVKPNQDAGKGLNLARLEALIDPRREWAQLYRDGWRILRDWFYDEGMHGMDWVALRDKYAVLLPHVAHRADLDYLFGELAGELNAGHVYVERGDEPGVERRPGGLLGAEFSAHPSGYFRIEKIFPGQNWSPEFYAPLAEPGLGVAVGDFVLAIDGVDARSTPNLYALLQNKADRVVELTVNRRPETTGARTVRVRTIQRETNLRYLDWVQSRRALVERLSGGRIGYVHLPNTALDGHRELFKQLPPQLDKEALIIDDRYNGGGFIPDRLIEVLARRPLNYWKRRGLDPQATPLLSFPGPKAMLINGLSSSGGDALPYYFRKLGLGPLIGTRTWGGLIGISGNPSLADGGSLLAATFRFLDTEGRWAVENEGVSPDIEVVDAPDALARGRDPSLERAVDELLRTLETTPRRTPTAPPAPTDFGQKRPAES